MKTAAIIMKEGNGNQAAAEEKRMLTVMIFSEACSVFLYIPLTIVLRETLGGNIGL